MSLIDNIEIKEKCSRYLNDFIALRNHIHQHPELSFQEKQTSAFIQSKLKEWDIPFQAGLGALNPGEEGTGIVATIHGQNPDSRLIALRADMDALPIQEKNNTPYSSRNAGVMHACGHDVHTTCLLGAAKILRETNQRWSGSVRLIFQPGEEKHPGGASLMIRDGVLENPKPAAIYALHVYPHLPYGCIGFRSGQYMASADEIYITVKGKGGHAALPHQTVDPIVIASQLILSLQQVISRNKNPLFPSVLSFGKIQGGFAGNVIPDEVRIEGTLRCMDEKWRAEAQERIKQHTVQLCRALGGDAQVDIPKGYPSLFNDPKETEKVKQVATSLLGSEHVRELDLRMAAEDFSFYSQQIPSSFFRIGTSFEGKFIKPVHNAEFDIYDEAIGIGVAMFCALVVEE